MKTVADLLNVLTLQKSNLNTYLTQTSCTAGNVTEVTNMVNNINNMLTYCEQVDGFKKAVFELKDMLIYGEPGLAIPVAPTPPGAPALVSPISGGLKVQRKRNARIKAGPGYTEPIGDALGLGSVSPIDPAETSPTIDVFAAQSGYVFSVVVNGRGQSDQWELFVRPVGGTSWTSMGSRTTKSSDFIYNPGSGVGDDTPVQLQFRVQLKKSDANFRDPSDIVMATVNP